jgi:hypothetical protein
MYDIVEKHFSIRIAPERSRGGSLVLTNERLSFNSYWYIPGIFIDMCNLFDTLHLVSLESIRHCICCIRSIKVNKPISSMVDRWLSGQCARRAMGDQNLLSQAPPCFGRHVKPLVPVAFAIVSTHSSFKEG